MSDAPAFLLSANDAYLRSVVPATENVDCVVRYREPVSEGTRNSRGLNVMSKSLSTPATFCNFVDTCIYSKVVKLTPTPIPIF